MQFNTDDHRRRLNGDINSRSLCIPFTPFPRMNEVMQDDIGRAKCSMNGRWSSIFPDLKLARLSSLCLSWNIIFISLFLKLGFETRLDEECDVRSSAIFSEISGLPALQLRSEISVELVYVACVLRLTSTTSLRGDA